MGIIGRPVYSWKSLKGEAGRFYRIKGVNKNCANVSKKKKNVVEIYCFIFDIHINMNDAIHFWEL